VTCIISLETGNGLVITRRAKKMSQENEQTGSGTIVDWIVEVSRDMKIIVVKQIGNEMAPTRPKPVFTPEGDLIIVVPGLSEQAARAETKSIASYISSAGLWGIDILDFIDFGFGHWQITM
ncbi:MAG: hypothetical protein WAO19_04305, partial [Candidatus Kryptoniota bacterium]